MEDFFTQNIDLIARSNSLKGIATYSYDINIAMQELDLERSVIEELVEDFVIQILTAAIKYEQYIFYIEYNISIELNLAKLKELAHKNLGVARNLRVQDMMAVLLDIQKTSIIAELKFLVEALRQCAIRLEPRLAKETLELIEASKIL